MKNISNEEIVFSHAHGFMTSGSIDSKGSSSKYQKQFLYLKYMTLYNCFAHSDSSLILFIFSFPSCPCVAAVFTLWVYLFFHSFHLPIHVTFSSLLFFFFLFFFYGFKSILHRLALELCQLFISNLFLFLIFSFRCAVASLLTVALHSNLSYLTEVMEVLLKDLMQKSSNAQPKLLLRRTESIVEKLLTNWMSICLYGFLRVCCSQCFMSLLFCLN